MIRLVRIELNKLLNYRPFKVLSILYAFILIFVPIIILEIMKWLQSLADGADFDGVNIMKVPVFHFPDIWQNLSFVSTFSEIILALIMIMMVTNEFSFKTVRQNVIDGFDRKDFFISKVLTAVMLSLASTIILFLVCIVVGLIYSPEIDMSRMFKYVEFIPAYFLEVFAYLSFALLVGFLIKRTAFAIILMLFYGGIQGVVIGILRNILPSSFDPVYEYFPTRGISHLVPFPFARYYFQEIQDYVSIQWLIITIVYIAIFLYLSYLRLRKSDL
ncbi:MAG: hypothetical protein AAFX87_01970 [Bacteroidota bacterium]